MKQTSKTKLKAQHPVENQDHQKFQRMQSSRLKYKPDTSLKQKPNIVQNIYSNSLQNTNDYTKNLKMINQRLKNDSISVNQSQEDLTSSMSIITGGVTLNY